MGKQWNKLFCVEQCFVPNGTTREQKSPLLPWVNSDPAPAKYHRSELGLGRGVHFGTIVAKSALFLGLIFFLETSQQDFNIQEST